MDIYSVMSPIYFHRNSNRYEDHNKKKVRNWNRLSRDVVNALTLDTFKAMLHWALSNLI